MQKAFSILFFFKLIIAILLLYYFEEEKMLSHDALQYIELGENLWNVEFGRYAEGHFYRETIRTPTYPIFLMLTKFLSLKAIAFFQIMMYFSSVLLLREILKKIISNTQLIHLFSLVFLLDFVGFFYAFQVLTETMFVFLLLLSIYFIYQKQHFKNYIFAGTFYALALLCRPILSLFIPIIFTYLIFQLFLKNTDVAKKWAVMLCSVFILVSPYLIYNYQYFNKIFISHIGEINLFHYRAAEVKAMAENKSFDIALKDLKSEWQLRNQEIEEDYKNPNYVLKSYDNMQAIALEEIKKNWHLTIYTTIKSSVKLMFSPSPETIKISTFQKAYFYFPIIFFQVIYNILIVVILIYLLFFFEKKSWRELLKKHFIVLAILLYFILVSSGAETGARFKIPILPFIVLSIAILSQNQKNGRKFSFQKEGNLSNQ